MTMNWQTLRTLIYSFQLDAANEYLKTNASDEVPKKFVTRVKKAIQYNASNSLLPSVKKRSPEVAGKWWTLWPMENRMRIKGWVRPECLRVALFVNDRLVKLVNTVPRPDDPQQRRVFRFNVKGDILRALPRKTVFGVGCELGYLKHREGGLTYRNARLSGDGSLFTLLDSTHFMTKKGRLQRRLDHDEDWKETALSAYTEFRNYFESRFGYKPFIICGTLLGWYRESDFIAHDDDMDVAYFSDRKTPEEIKAELKTIVSRMISDGYDIKLARKSGFFKPCVNGLWFDVFPMWSDQDCLWMMNTTRQRTGPETILPLQTGHFRGVEVYVPRDTERYIELEYGPNWRTPDPGYRSVGEPGTAQYLSGSCMNTAELKELYADVQRMAANRNGIGRLSIADRDIDALG